MVVGEMWGGKGMRREWGKLGELVWEKEVKGMVRGGVRMVGWWLKMWMRRMGGRRRVMVVKMWLREGR